MKEWSFKSFEEKTFPFPSFSIPSNCNQRRSSPTQVLGSKVFALCEGFHGWRIRMHRGAVPRETEEIRGTLSNLLVGEYVDGMFGKAT